MYQRLCKPLLSNSFFLFGSRGTGKTSLLRGLLPESEDCLWIDLLDDELAGRLSAHPRYFEELIPKTFNSRSWVVVDEIQRIPTLLNYVHRLIENRKIKFALTGSSARKLKRGGANLLAGRAFLNSLFPLTCLELGDDFNLDSVLQWGALPKIFDAEDGATKQAYLKSYIHSYIRQEIKEEQIVRKLEPFLKFIEVAAQSNGQILNYSKIGRDVGCDSKAVERYFEILDDTLLGFHLEPYHRSVRKRQTAKSKFYFFDLGVKRAIENTLTVPLLPGSHAYGFAFEHFFVTECIRLSQYFRTDDRFYYFRTKDDLEVDLIVERPGQRKILIEIKSSERVDELRISRLKNLAQDLMPCELWVASREQRARALDKCEILPWREVITRLYGKF